MLNVSQKANEPALYGLIGNTPLVPLQRLGASSPVAVWVKLEGLNPGGSVKDRPARSILRAAEARGLMGPDRVLLDATSGNTGIAYAMLCAAAGHRCEICLPANASPLKQHLIRSYGATLVLTDPEAGSDGAVIEARDRFAEEPERYFYADQYNNPANLLAHRGSTAPEIWSQTSGRVTHFVAAMGTSGTLLGTGAGLRHERPDVRIVAIQPDAPFHGLEGVKHMQTAIVPGIYDPDAVDREITVGTEAAQDMTRRLAAEEGLLTGVSGGANVVGALEVAKRLGPGSLVVTVLPDRGERSLNEEWW